jgi:hypothetical protein
MPEGPVDDQLIEISDPTEDTPEVEAAPQVVIQYHERGGVPWMLIPPLLVLSAVGAIVLYAKFAPRSRWQQQAPPALVKAADLPKPIIDAPIPPNMPAPIPPEPVAAAAPGPVAAAPGRIAASGLVVAPEPKAEDSLPAILPPPPVEPVAEPAEVAEPAKVAVPAPFPRVAGVGFDPKALDADRAAEPRADPALAPAVGEDKPVERDQPREVDPDLLPPDPREARLRQQKRRLEILQRVEDERSRFHDQLKVICRNFREDSGPEILEMRKQFDLKIDPRAEKDAAELLGKSGKYVGADRRTRIALLRSLGYPEPVILDNLFFIYEKHHIGERDGPMDASEAYYLSALSLLRNPPRSKTPTSRAVSDPGDRSVPGR